MRRIQSTLIRDLANRKVVTVERDTPLAKCATLMRDQHVGSVVVVERELSRDRPIGIVTDRDIVIEAVALALDPRTLTAGDIMTGPLGTVREDDDIVDALARMRELGVRRLPVTTTDGRLAGIVAVDDLLYALTEQFSALANVLGAEYAKEGATRSSNLS